MKLLQTGGCQCGKVRYEITEEPQAVYTCHCLDCQRLTGGAFSLGIVVPENAFHLTGVEPRRLQRKADSGRVNTRLVCPECGSWVCGMPRDGVVRVRGGTLGRLSVRRTVPPRLLMGFVAFLVLMSAEVGLGAVLGRSLGDQLAGYGSPAGRIGLAAQAIFAVFPVIQVWW